MDLGYSGEPEDDDGTGRSKYPFEDIFDRCNTKWRKHLSGEGEQSVVCGRYQALAHRTLAGIWVEIRCRPPQRSSQSAQEHPLRIATSFFLRVDLLESQLCKRISASSHIKAVHVLPAIGDATRSDRGPLLQERHHPAVDMPTVGVSTRVVKPPQAVETSHTCAAGYLPDQEQDAAPESGQTVATFSRQMTLHLSGPQYRLRLLVSSEVCAHTLSWGELLEWEAGSLRPGHRRDRQTANFRGRRKCLEGEEQTSGSWVRSCCSTVCVDGIAEWKQGTPYAWSAANWRERRAVKQTKRRKPALDCACDGEVGRSGFGKSQTRPIGMAASADSPERRRESWTGAERGDQ